ncbi:hypothetical protein EDC04DRAFT_3092555 [Pisolithus marmoratus]|nr:hypothetical protein EDC04DRAFT_3092555 [Pisolithus marmoratus]
MIATDRGAEAIGHRLSLYWWVDCSTMYVYARNMGWGWSIVSKAKFKRMNTHPYCPLTPCPGSQGRRASLVARTYLMIYFRVYALNFNLLTTGCSETVDWTSQRSNWVTRSCDFQCEASAVLSDGPGAEAEGTEFRGLRSPNFGWCRNPVRKGKLFYGGLTNFQTQKIVPRTVRRFCGKRVLWAVLQIRVGADEADGRFGVPSEVDLKAWGTLPGQSGVHGCFVRPQGFLCSFSGTK